MLLKRHRLNSYSFPSLLHSLLCLYLLLRGTLHGFIPASPGAFVWLPNLLCILLCSSYVLSLKLSLSLWNSHSSIPEDFCTGVSTLIRMFIPRLFQWLPPFHDAALNASVNSGRTFLNILPSVSSWHSLPHPLLLLLIFLIWKCLIYCCLCLHDCLQHEVPPGQCCWVDLVHCSIWDALHLVLGIVNKCSKNIEGD